MCSSSPNATLGEVPPVHFVFSSVFVGVGVLGVQPDREHPPLFLLRDFPLRVRPLILGSPFLLERVKDVLRILQNAVAALKLADRALILDTGTVVYDGSAQSVLDDEKLRAGYLAI